MSNMLDLFTRYYDLAMFFLALGFLAVCSYGLALLRQAVSQDAERLKREGKNHVEKKAKPIV